MKKYQFKEDQGVTNISEEKINELLRYAYYCHYDVYSPFKYDKSDNWDSIVWNNNRLVRTRSSNVTIPMSEQEFRYAITYGEDMYQFTYEQGVTSDPEVINFLLKKAYGYGYQIYGYNADNINDIDNYRVPHLYVLSSGEFCLSITTN